MSKEIMLIMDDVHLEGRPPEMRREFINKIKARVSEINEMGKKPIVICAGDIGEGLEGITWISEIQAEIIYICGNHEFWNNDYYEVQQNLAKFAESMPNIHFLNNNSIVINGIRFIGTTLWTSLGDFLPWENKNYVIRYFSAMGDFKRITAKKWYSSSNIARLNEFLSKNGIDKSRIEEVVKNQNFNPLIEMEENYKAKKFIAAQLEKEYDGHTVVITHHLPTVDLWSSKVGLTVESMDGYHVNDEKAFLDSAKGNVSPSKDVLMMSFYANDLADVFETEYAPDLWIHGHLHQEITAFRGKTQIVSSPVGYLKQGKEMVFKEVSFDNPELDVAQYIKKEVEKYDWNGIITDNVRQLEKVIINFELAVSSGSSMPHEFAPIINAFRKIHEMNVNKINQQTQKWLHSLVAIKFPGIIIPNDPYQVKRLSGIFEIKSIKPGKPEEIKFKLPELFMANVNDYSFSSEDKYKSQKKENEQFYHYKEWLKDIQKIEIQISQYKKTLIEFCEGIIKQNTH